MEERLTAFIIWAIIGILIIILGIYDMKSKKTKPFGFWANADVIPVELHGFLQKLQDKYATLHILMDVYTEFGAKASKYKNPVKDVGVTKLYGVDDEST